MNIEHFEANGEAIAVVSSEEKLIVDTQSALELAMAVKHEAGAEKLLLPKTHL